MRSAAAVCGGILRETTDVVLPPALRRTRTYDAIVYRPLGKGRMDSLQLRVVGVLLFVCAGAVAFVCSYVPVYMLLSKAMRGMPLVDRLSVLRRSPFVWYVGLIAFVATVVAIIGCWIVILSTLSTRLR